MLNYSNDRCFASHKVGTRQLEEIANIRGHQGSVPSILVGKPSPSLREERQVVHVYVSHRLGG